MHKIKMDILCPHAHEYTAMADLWEASVRASHTFLSEEDLQFYKSLIVNTYLSAVELRCAKDRKGTMLGFIGVSDTTIEMLFVSPDHFGKGVGKTLLHTAVSELGATQVDVNEHNTEARLFYEHMGFTITGRSPVDYHGKPYPLLHMILCRQCS